MDVRSGLEMAPRGGKSDSKGDSAASLFRGNSSGHDQASQASTHSDCRASR